MTAPLLDDGSGKIAQAVLVLSEFSIQTFPEAIQNVLTALPSEARLIILTTETVCERVRAWLEQADRNHSAQLQLMSPELNASLWVQDPLLVRSDGAVSVSSAFDRYDDRDATRHLIDTMEWSESEAPVHVDGGNVLVHGDVVLISADAEAERSESSELDPSRTVLSIGTKATCATECTRSTECPETGWQETLDFQSAEGTHQPIFHLDHMIAPCGFDHDKPRFMVGCPRIGAKAAGHPLWAHAQAEAFDEIAQLLRGHGLAVVRNPQPLGWVDRPERTRRRWFYLPVNNVLIDGDWVLLPCFGNDAWPEFEAIDAENTRLWQDLGYCVVPIHGAMALAEAMGGPRCMVKVTERS